MGWTAGVLIPAGARFSSSTPRHCRLAAHPGSSSLGVWGGRSVKLNTHLCLVPRFWRRGAAPPLPCKSSWRCGQLNTMRGFLRFDSRRGLGIFLFIASRTALGPTQPPMQWVSGAPSLWIRRPGREADHSPPSSAEVKECLELYLHSPNTPSWRGA
jgi:hypothetical protein